MGASGVEGGRRGFNPGSSGGDTAHAEMSLILGQWNLGPAPRLREFAPVTGDFCDAYGRERRAGVVGACRGHVAAPVARGSASDYLAAMTDASSIDATFAELVENFDLLEDWEQRIGYVIDLGKDLEPLDEADRIETNKVPGCAAQVWLATERHDGRLVFHADSDSAISKGNVALLLMLYSDRAPAEILAFDARAALDRLGLPHALTPQRANGLNNMVGRIRAEAALG